MSKITVHPSHTSLTYQHRNQSKTAIQIFKNNQILIEFTEATGFSYSILLNSDMIEDLNKAISKEMKNG